MQAHAELFLDRLLDVVDHRHVIIRGSVVNINDKASVLGRYLGTTCRIPLQARVMNQLTGKVARGPFENTPAGWQVQGLFSSAPGV